MDVNTLSFIGHRDHQFLSPVSAETLDRIMAAAALPSGSVAYDLGCGTGNMAVHLAQRWSLAVRAVDRSPMMIEEARRRAAVAGASGALGEGTVEFVHQGSVEFLAQAGPADMVVAIGALALTAGSQEATEVLRSLADSVKPGGLLLWGESYWRKPPSDMLRIILGPTVAVYGAHHEYVHAGEEAGLGPLYAVTASDQDWDEYTWRYVTALENHLRDHPGDPDAAEIANRARGWRSLYLAEGRDTIGFGLYLFRKPA